MKTIDPLGTTRKKEDWKFPLEGWLVAEDMTGGKKGKGGGKSAGTIKSASPVAARCQWSKSLLIKMRRSREKITKVSLANKPPKGGAKKKEKKKTISRGGSRGNRTWEKRSALQGGKKTLSCGGRRKKKAVGE